MDTVAAIAFLSHRTRVNLELKRLEYLKQEAFQPELKGGIALGKLKLGGEVVRSHYDYDRGNGKKGNLADFYDGGKFDIVGFYQRQRFSHFVRAGPKTGVDGFYGVGFWKNF
jgi:hypothetical protein